ncbi:MAG: flagellar biosynthesis anti-sigma factor FlgM [Lachnospiraceae bacterium]
MRIDGYSKVQQLYGVNNSQKIEKTSTIKKKDEISISNFGREIQLLQAAVKESDDIREDVVAPIKAKIENGTYKVSEEKFASKLLEQYKTFSF